MTLFLEEEQESYIDEATLLKFSLVLN